MSITIPAHLHSAFTRRAMTADELADEARARFGDDALDWAYQCPSCGDIATAAEFPAEARHRIGSECIGRHVPGRGCGKAATGIFGAPWLIKLTDNGPVVGCFPLAPERPR